MALMNNMIDIPPKTQVTRDLAVEKRLYDEARLWIEKQGDVRARGIHASDLINPRKGYFRHLHPEASTDREIGLFLVGKVLHAFVLAHKQPGSPVSLTETDEGQRYSDALGIYYSPDKQIDDTIVEFKTNRAFREPELIGDLDTYLVQVLIYLAATQLTTAEIWTLYINLRDESGKTSPQFHVYKVKISEEELKATTYNVRKVRDLLADCIKAEDHLPLPLCPAWMCHPEQCGYWNRCKPEGRFNNSVYINSRRK